MAMTAGGPTCRRLSKYLNQISDGSDRPRSTLRLRSRQAARLLRMLSVIPWLSIGCVEHPAPARPPLPDVVLVTIDTPRADRVGVYGAATPATPNLDRLARRGVTFDRATAHAPLTLPSHASILTGQYPAEHHVADNAGFSLPARSPTIAE